MTGFQIFLLVFFGMVLIGSVVTLARGVSPKLSLVTMIVSLAACGATIRPDATTDLARMVGIQRGTDLILYCTVLVMMVGFFLFYLRLRALRRELTEVVRHVAMSEAVERPDGAAHREPRDTEPRNRGSET